MIDGGGVGWDCGHIHDGKRQTYHGDSTSCVVVAVVVAVIDNGNCSSCSNT